MDQIKIDGFVLAWTAHGFARYRVVFGLAPAWQSSRLNLNEALKIADAAQRKRRPTTLANPSW